jgi:NhaA family Na+:H+ antiporter
MATRLPRKLFQPLQQFIQTESSGGIILLACAATALAWANSPWGGSYEHLWEMPLTLGVPGFALREPLHLWINDALMAVFFLLVGLEIKREVLIGELASLKRSALPLAAAAGGMVVPAMIYAAINAGAPTLRGWGIPMATDIAFALGAVSLLGSRVPTGLKVFLTALAIVDDLGAVLVIALFYTAELSLPSLGAAAAVFAVLMACNLGGVRTVWVYLGLGVLLWIALFHSGVHATVAGVLLAMAVPAGTDSAAEAGPGPAAEAASPLLRLERALYRPVSYGIMPVFALANAGLHLDSSLAGAFAHPITRGVLLGLLIGKPVGITAASWLVVRTGLAALPERVTWRALFGVAWVGGIGFTMSLFIAGLAFSDPAQLAAAKAGVLAGSLLAGTGGALWLIFNARATPEPAVEAATG